MRTNSRRAFNVSKAMQKELSSAFPNLIRINDGCDSIQEECESGAISVFDHWLLENEYEKLNLYSDDVIDMYLKKMDAFLYYLIDNYECYTFRVVGRGRKRRVSYRKFSDRECAISVLKQSRYPIRSKYLYRLVIPTLGISYFEGWDYTNYLYSYDLINIEKIRLIAEAMDLYFLDI
ncbi:hypothetical protein RFA42_000830 [Vibrio vulnificus]|uniref:hypothetical protein n=1 Tax=Vibrio vulnificus TaxID=672 RepID=UPI00092740BE|nr:hypothetical protein [Vibrio vulnificus]ARN65409.1 hypothetical protein FORC36_0892 [Vibrio vulnificus]EHT4940720.1 hypothetical protein [Vibrio vulnificus]EID4390897.1 hypothetical protein [Vibrio vulnificus]EIN9357952.1 hypothetical protein [Vibrio vulnificus]EJI1277068.1 hypothetical protein [Vibrio vulnificus]